MENIEKILESSEELIKKAKDNMHEGERPYNPPIYQDSDPASEHRHSEYQKYRIDLGIYYTLRALHEQNKAIIYLLKDKKLRDKE